MNKMEKAKAWEIAFKIARKYDVSLTYRYNSKRNIDTYSFVKYNSTFKRLRIEVGERINLIAYNFDIISNARKCLHSTCKFDDIENIHIADLCEYNDNWEYFVEDLMCHLGFTIK